MQSHCHSVTQLHCHTVTLSHSHTVTQSRCHAVTQSRSHAVTLSRSHAVTRQPFGQFLLILNVVQAALAGQWSGQIVGLSLEVPCLTLAAS